MSLRESSHTRWYTYHSLTSSPFLFCLLVKWNSTSALSCIAFPWNMQKNCHIRQTPLLFICMFTFQKSQIISKKCITLIVIEFCYMVVAWLSKLQEYSSESPVYFQMVLFCKKHQSKHTTKVPLEHLFILIFLLLSI